MTQADLTASTDRPFEALTRTQHGRRLLVLALPLIGSNLAQMAMNVTDTVMLGWYDVTALAAATLATSLYFLIFIVGAGFAWAVMPVVATAAEAGDPVRVRRVTRMGIWVGMIYAAVFVPPLMWAEDLFLALGQEPEVAAAGEAYLRIAAWAMVPGLVAMVMRSFLSALEHTAVLLWSTLGMAVCNALLNYALIFGNWGAPELGIRGAAIASLSMAMLQALVLLAYALRRLPEYDLVRRLWRPDLDVLGQVVRLGVPIGLTSLAEGGLFVATGVMVGWIGEVPLAAHGIALQITSVAFMIQVGLSQAATVRAGRALGRRDEAALRMIGQSGVALSVVSAGLVGLIFVTMPEPFVAAFVDPGDPARDAVVATGITLLSLAALFQIVDALQVMALGLLRGVQDTGVPMVFAAISYWLIGMPAGYLLGFPLGLGAAGVWLGLVVGLGLAASTLLWRFWSRSVRIGSA
ncbi:MATE family multidrug resistance protein [Limimaricola soesokkakensis]|uniref:Multidrug-efflux transporter n=1 Tax=Limimaricola soesokkakensis TaxID=1343159 RepID=A0A1X6Y9C9_9RHOB|nr:MATE family efflux transporter [Limimaricola soesokkakensis]PSK87196.1 MATE family multidrug resistance protein [Limimaricola soesokkakensis]SLN14806.1 Multidrug resistance protein MdtK [Limimaricola soesokkakensis]